MSTVDTISTKINLYKGDDAYQLMHNISFKRKWASLLSRVDGFNVLQSPGFVIPWFKFKESTFSPIVIASQNEINIDAIVILCQNKNTKEISFAGFEDAEYHGWIAEEHVSKFFIEQVLLLVKKLGVQNKWIWGYCPENTNIKALQKLSIPGISIKIEHTESGQWNLEDVTNIVKFEKSRRRKKLRRLLDVYGEVETRRISSEEELIKVIDYLKPHIDFRNQAVFGILPFEDNPGLDQFCLDTYKSGVAHSIAIYQENRPIGYSNVICHKGIVFPGITGFVAEYARLGIGRLLIMEHAKTLVEDGYKIYDMTPGKESYKAEYATEMRDTYQATVFFNPISERISKTKFAFKKQSIHLLEKTGHSVDGIKDIKYNFDTYADFFNSRGRAKGYINAFKFIRQYKFIFSLFDYSVLEHPPTKSTGSKIYVSFNDVEAIRKYKDYRPYPNQDHIVSRSWHRFNKNQSCITIVQDDQLIFYGWIADIPKKAQPYLCLEDYPAGEDANILYDVYIPSDSTVEKVHASLSVAQSAIAKRYEGPLTILIDHDMHSCIDTAKLFGMNRISTGTEMVKNLGI